MFCSVITRSSNWEILQGGAWAVCRFKGELGKKEGVVFLRGVDTQMHTMSSAGVFKVKNIYCTMQAITLIGAKLDIPKNIPW